MRQAWSGYHGRFLWQPQVSARASISCNVAGAEGVSSQSGGWEGASGGGEEDGGAPPPTPEDVVSVCGDRRRQSVSQRVSQPQPYRVCQSECVSVGVLVSVSVTAGGGGGDSWEGSTRAPAFVWRFIGESVQGSRCAADGVW